MVKKSQRQAVKQDLIHNYCQLKKISCSPIVVRQCLNDWWIHSRNDLNYGLELSGRGYHILRDVVKLKFFEIPVEPYQTNFRLLIGLQRGMESPYYLAKDRVCMLDEKMAVVLTLFGGNLTKFQQFLDRN